MLLYSPNGLFDPLFTKLGEYNDKMVADMEANASHDNGFLGATTWHNAADRTTAPEIMSMYYFRSYDDLHNWAFGPVHHAGWEWWSKLVSEHRDHQIGLSHEVFEASVGRFETLYGNYAPAGFGEYIRGPLC